MRGLPFVFMDGCNLPVLRHEDTVVQDEFFALWKHAHTVSSLFVRAPDGTIIHTNYNVPGAVHDSTIANEAYYMLREMHLSFTIMGNSVSSGREAGSSLRRHRRSWRRVPPAASATSKSPVSQRVATKWGNGWLAGRRDADTAT